MKKTFFMLFLFISINSYSKNWGEFYCFEPQYGYINGILNQEEEDAKNSSLKIKESLELKKDVNTFYNQSEGAAVDLIRTVFQKIAESNEDGLLLSKKKSLIIQYSRQFLADAMDITDKTDEGILKWVTIDNQKSIDTKIMEFYDKKKRMIIFSHSQGNMYANKACMDLGRSIFENIQIATPAAEVKCGEKSHYTSIHSDEMVDFLERVGRPVGILLGLDIKSPLKTNTPQQNGRYLEQKSYLNPPNLPVIDIYNFYQFITSDNKFGVHSIDNYLSNPPSLAKIKQHHQNILSKNFQEANRNIIEAPEFTVNCDNIDDFVDTKIELTRTPASILEKNVKASSKNPEKVYIEKKGEKYVISSFDLDSWFAKKFWWLYILAGPFALILGGAVAQSLKDSENSRKP
jgi:hypothetical protein